MRKGSIIYFWLKCLRFLLFLPRLRFLKTCLFIYLLYDVTIISRNFESSFFCFILFTSYSCFTRKRVHIASHTAIRRVVSGLLLFLKSALSTRLSNGALNQVTPSSCHSSWILLYGARHGMGAALSENVRDSTLFI